MRAMGIRVAPDGLQLTLFLPVATAEQTIANVRANPRIALTLSEISTHRTLQIKGAVLDITEGTDEDHWYVNLYREMFAADLAWAGQSKANTIAVTNWPCHAVLVEIAVVYTQTPGPTAGLQLPVIGVKP
jgi:hypothetical protein